MVTVTGIAYEAAKMPRTAIIPVVNNEEYVLNAAPVSSGVISVNPL